MRNCGAELRITGAVALVSLRQSERKGVHFVCASSVAGAQNAGSAFEGKVGGGLLIKRTTGNVERASICMRALCFNYAPRSLLLRRTNVQHVRYKTDCPRGMLSRATQ